MFASLYGQMSSLSFVQRTFDWGGEKGKCRDWGTIAFQVNTLKNSDFKTNTEILWHPGFDPDFSEKIL